MNTAPVYWIHARGCVVRVETAEPVDAFRAYGVTVRLLDPLPAHRGAPALRAGASGPWMSDALFTTREAAEQALAVEERQAAVEVLAQ